MRALVKKGGKGVQATAADLATVDLPVYALPLEVVELLDKRADYPGPLTEREKRLAKNAVGFLEKIKVGGEIASPAQMRIVPDPVSLDAYHYTKRALYSLDTRARARLVQNSERVLKELSEGTPVSQIDSSKLHDTRKFFRALMNQYLT
jgi:hypothetical protein